MFKPPHPFSLEISPEMMLPTRVGAKRLLIADDHAMVREGLALMVQAEWPGAVCEFAQDYARVLAALDASVLCPEPAFDALILDLRMPGMRGAESVLEITRRARGSPVLVCTALDDPGLLWRLDKAGVFAVVNKAAGSQEFLLYLRAMLETTALAAEPRPSARSTRPAPLTALAPLAGSALLTPRQRDILKLVHEGKPSKVIASQLGIGLGTVKSHLHALYAAMGVTSRTEAVALSQDWML